MLIVFAPFISIDNRPHYNKSAFRVGNSTFAATIILDEKKTTFSKVFKGYTISKIEVDGADAASGSETTLREPVNRSTPSYITIAQAAKNIKPESSKIVDENGKNVTSNYDIEFIDGLLTVRPDEQNN